MRDMNRRNVLRAATASMAGLTLLGAVQTVSADKHQPPAEHQVTVENENIEYIEANPNAGFHYPYFLYAPPSLNTSEESPRPILIQGNNSDDDDDFTTHLNQAREFATGGLSRELVDHLGIPLLVPVFPRQRENPEPWWVYVQTLDPDTFTIEDSPLERVDLQLLNMVDHAKSQLEANGHSIASEIHINGFSASGTFANRFTILHPERVNAASYGGIKVLTLPKHEIDDDIPVFGDLRWNEMSHPIGTERKELPYPIGVANLETLTGTAFNEKAWLNTPQYIYVGDEDQPDPESNGHRSFGNLYDGEVIQTEPERHYGMPQLIEDIYGVEEFDERFQVSKAVYGNTAPEATITVYEGYGHTSRPAIDDLIEFHRNEIQSTYGSNSIIEQTPGFGFGTTLSGFVGAGYILKRRIESDT